MQRSFTFALLLVVCLVMLAVPIVAQEEQVLPLAERGPYHVGQTRIEVTDAARDDREIGAVLWYPAIVPPDQADEAAYAERSHVPLNNLTPDLSDGPYPVVFYSPDYGGLSTDFRPVLEPLVSHGFVVVGLDHPEIRSALTYLDRPLDVLAVLDQLVALNEDPASPQYGLMNTDQVGVVGFGSGAVTGTALAGARLDPEASQPWVEWLGPLVVGIYPDWSWEALQAYHDQVGMTEADGMWNAVTDPRIRAVVAYEPCALSLFGPRGLAEATVPSLVIGGTGDTTCDYELDTVLTAEQMVNAPVDLVSLVGAYHQLPYGTEATSPERILQFVNAFLGLHLQDKTAYADYLTAEYAETLDQVAWGVADFQMLAPEHIPDFTFTDGGTLTLGEPVTGEVLTAADRLGFGMSLPEASALNLTASGTGRRTDTSIYAPFDTVLYVLDNQGEVVAWNDELDMGDNNMGNFDAGFSDFELPAGDYAVVVGGFRMAGPFELVVELAQE